jgi:hypothetical protein
MNKPKRSWKRLLTGLAAFVLFAVVLVGFLGYLLFDYYLYSIGSPHDPREHGYIPVERVTEATGGFVMSRYRIKAPRIQRFLSGDPHQRNDDGYDTVVVISELSGDMIARLGHWDGNLKLVVTPSGVTGPGGIDWKVAP